MGDDLVLTLGTGFDTSQAGHTEWRSSGREEADCKLLQRIECQPRGRSKVHHLSKSSCKLHSLRLTIVLADEGLAR